MLFREDFIWLKGKCQARERSKKKKEWNVVDRIMVSPKCPCLIPGTINMLPYLAKGKGD